MIYRTTKELLKKKKKYMDLNDIKMKELAINMGKNDSQSASQYFRNGNPRCNSIFEICDALNVELDVNIFPKGDTE